MTEVDKKADGPAMVVARRSLRALYLAVDKSIADGVSRNVYAGIAEARSTAVAETWEAAMKIANTCVQEHDHTPKEDDPDDDHINPASCVYFALEAARGRDENR